MFFQIRYGLYWPPIKILPSASPDWILAYNSMNYSTVSTRYNGMFCVASPQRTNGAILSSFANIGSQTGSNLNTKNIHNWSAVILKDSILQEYKLYYLVFLHIFFCLRLHFYLRQEIVTHVKNVCNDISVLLHGAKSREVI